MKRREETRPSGNPGTMDTVSCAPAELLPQAREVMPRFSRFAGGPAHQFRGGMTLPVAVHFFLEPAQQALVAAFAKLSGHFREIGRGPAHELGGVEVAQGVGGEIPKSSQAPVDVLQTTARVVRHFQAEQFPELLVPN